VASTFVVPLFLRSSHLQTIGASLPLWAPPRGFRPAHAETLRLPLPSGGALHAHVWWQDGLEPRQAVIVVHGVGGSSASRYVVRAAVALYRAGYHVVRLDLRGAGESIPDAPSLYHAGLTEDLRVAVDGLALEARVKGVALVGFSLGGHVALRFAGELAEHSPSALRGVVAISAPLDLVEVTSAMERLRARPYHAYVLRHLVQQGRAFARAHPGRVLYDSESLGRLTRIRAYDDSVVAPMHGFSSALDYYQRASAGPLVSRIRLPTMLVHADDDPMVPAASVRPWLSNASSAVHQVWSERGGHVGWFSGMSERHWVNTWAMTKTLEFLGRLNPPD
jgi:predicted alpha/beta-fold hydrolase